jgi:alkylhydroperoxidase family enzyme
VLRKNFFSSDELAAIARDFRNAGLAPGEVAMMSFAQKVITDTHNMSEEDFDALRQHGFSDEEIFDMVLAASARSFFTKTIDTVGAVPDEAYLVLGPELVQLLSMGRPFP